MMQNMKTPEWEWLARACLSDNAGNVKKYAKRWRKQVDPDDMDYRSMRLVPFFVDHMKAHGLPIPHEKRTAIIYKFWWVKTQWILSELNNITEIFHKHGIPLMILKGAALYRFYDKPLHRTMSDLDLIVPQRYVVQAFELLEKHGFVGNHTVYNLYKRFPQLTQSEMHAFLLIHKKSGLEIDLHWANGNRLPRLFCEEMWSQARPDPLNNKRLIPPPHLQFLLTVINGAFSEYHGSWLLDAKQMLSKFTQEEYKGLTSKLEVYNMPVWPHIVQCLQDFGIKSEGVDYKTAAFYLNNCTKFPRKSKSFRQQKNWVMKLDSILKSYLYSKRCAIMVNNYSQGALFLLRFFVWRVMYAFMGSAISNKPSCSKASTQGKRMNNI